MARRRRRACPRHRAARPNPLRKSPSGADARAGPAPLPEQATMRSRKNSPAGVRPQHAELEQARQTLGVLAESERKIRMRQQRRPIGAGAGQREQDQPRHHARARGGERRAAGIVDLDIPAQQLRAHALGKAAIRRHQRRRAALVLQRLAQADGDGQSLLAFVGGLDQRDAGKRRFDRARRLRGAPARPEIGGVGRAKSFGGEGVARGKRAARAPRAGRRPRAKRRWSRSGA